MIRLKFALVDWKDVTRIGASVAIVLLLVADTAFGQVQYAITDLGAFGGPNSRASAINAGGQVVGWAEAFWDYDYPEHAFFYSGGSMQDLGSLYGYYGNNSCACGINNSGQVVGGGPERRCLPLQ